MLKIPSLITRSIKYSNGYSILQVCGPESWNGTKEKQFEKVCDEIVSTMDNVHAAVNACRDARSKKPFIHFIVTVMTLISLAWIGNRISK